MKSGKRIVFLILVIILVALPVIVYVAFPGAAFRLLVQTERGLAGLDQRSIEIEGFHIAYVEGGKGDVLLLLHGFGANKDNWTRVARYLTPHFRVIAPDLPGFGESTADPNEDYSIAAQAHRVHGFVRALGIERFHLGGNSMGGHIAGMYASRHPQQVSSLWLLAPAGVAAANPSEMHHRIVEGKENPLVVKRPEDFERLLDFVTVKRPFLPGVVRDRLIQEAVAHSELNERIFKQLRSDETSPPLETLLSGSTVPMLVLWGSEDRVLDVSGARVLESALAEIEVVVMEETGHVPMIEKPKETAVLYLSFLGIR